MIPSVYSFILVSIQFFCLAFLILTGQWLVSETVALMLELGAIVLGLWAIYAVRSSKLNVFPEWRKGAVLVRHGPYAWIRHPMYLSVILLGLSLLLNSFSWLRFSVWIILCIDLLFKIIHEEKLILKKAPEYRVYMKNTKRLIPFIL